MPVGKPTSDGDITLGSRHYSGQSRIASALAPWVCPACGKTNEARRPEVGCGHCGSGDPEKSQAGQARTGERPRGEAVETAARPRPRVTNPRADQGGVEPHPGAASVRILRLIEYLVTPGKSADPSLRNSLIGRMEFDWGTLTATIIDSCDARQEDLLGLARRQPGVWLGNKDAMNQQDNPLLQCLPDGRVVPVVPPVPHDTMGWELVPKQEKPRMEPPDTGPTWTARDGLIAKHIALEFGVKLAHTLALALSSIAEELAGNSEPEKFLTQQECLSLANALLHEVPADWLGDLPSVDASDAPSQASGET